VTEIHIDGVSQQETRTPWGLTDADKAFRSAVVRALLQPLTAVSGRVQLAKSFIEADPARAKMELDEAREHLERIDRLLAELRVRAPGES
jgi:hypothetical protein